MRLPTVKIIAKNETGYIIINESDFDAKTDKLFAKPPVNRFAKSKRKPGPKPKPKRTLESALSYDAADEGDPSVV
jgi:hypothetical protein